MLTIFVRTLLIYGSLLLTLRVMGKRQIGELEVTDLVTTLLISEIASLPITNQDIPVSYALIPVYASDGQTKQMNANAAPGLFSYMESISDNASVDAAGNISEK